MQGTVTTLQYESPLQMVPSSPQVQKNPFLLPKLVTPSPSRHVTKQQLVIMHDRQENGKWGLYLKSTRASHVVICNCDQNTTQLRVGDVLLAVNGRFFYRDFDGDFDRLTHFLRHFPLSSAQFLVLRETGTGVALPLKKTQEDDWLRTQQRWKRQREAEELEIQERESSSVPVDFWSRQGYASIDEWLRQSKAKWRVQYSWNRSKKRRIRADCQRRVSVHDPEWYRVRRTQWRMQRRKRHVGEPTEEVELRLMDELILEQRRQAEAKKKPRLPLDWIRLVDPRNGCPDEVLAHMCGFLPCLEHGKLLSIDRKSRFLLQERNDLWKTLCPSRWSLPRRPRKPWHELYCTRLCQETEEARKRGDDVLLKALSLLFTGDQLQTLQKLVNRTDFDVNYSSGVVGERNSLLNLAVIHQRHKVVRWLVQEKEADLETCDRGEFTPLLNAAWAGDRSMVRFLLQQGADRTKVGMFHYSKPLSSPEFEGLTAEGWAMKRGHEAVAKLIRLGL